MFLFYLVIGALQMFFDDDDDDDDDVSQGGFPWGRASRRNIRIPL